jgi:hypothetical protein
MDLSRICFYYCIAQPCEITEQVYSDVLSVTFGRNTSCESLCFNDPKCWAAVQYVPSNCVQLALPGHGVESFTLASKSCINGMYYCIPISH